MAERNAGVPPERRIEFRVGVHLGDVGEESDGDLMGDGVDIAARLEGIAKPGAICLSEDAYRQVKSRLDLAVSDLGSTQLKNIAEPIRVYSIDSAQSLTWDIPLRFRPLQAIRSSENLGPLKVPHTYDHVRKRYSRRPEPHVIRENNIPMTTRSPCVGTRAHRNYERKSYCWDQRSTGASPQMEEAVS
jgi:hypothetical protein